MWTLQVYSILNLAFWLALAAVVITRYQPDDLRTWLSYLAILWSAGVLHSMDRSLTDLPAATLGLAAVCIGQSRGRWLMALSALFKETSLLSFVAVSGWNPAASPRKWLGSLLPMLLMALPLAVWMGWVYLRFGQTSTAELGNFAWPGVALWDKLSTATGQLSGLNDLGLAVITFRILEVVAPVSLLVQSVYMLSRPDPRSALWLYGVGFAMLLWVIGAPVWAGQQAYTRALLPLTLSFNLLLLERRPASFYYWLVLGNIGLCGMVLKIPYDALTQALAR